MHDISIFNIFVFVDINIYKNTYTKPKRNRRTIPSDRLQAKGLIALCVELGWSSIAIVYSTGAYGSPLSLSIQELAKEKDIYAASIGVTQDKVESLKFAAEQIKELEIYIIILIVQETVSDKVKSPFHIFKKAGIVGYPIII